MVVDLFLLLPVTTTTTTSCYQGTWTLTGGHSQVLFFATYSMILAYVAWSLPLAPFFLLPAPLSLLTDQAAPCMGCYK